MSQHQKILIIRHVEDAADAVRAVIDLVEESSADAVFKAWKEHQVKEAVRMDYPDASQEEKDEIENASRDFVYTTEYVMSSDPTFW